MIRADKFLPPADRLALLLDAEGIRYTREFAFATGIGRRWRADFFIPNSIPPLLLECEGGVYTGGRHTRGKGYSLDCEKYNNAATLGYVVLRFTPEMIDNGRAIEIVRRALKIVH